MFLKIFHFVQFFQLYKMHFFETGHVFSFTQIFQPFLTSSKNGTQKIFRTPDIDCTEKYEKFNSIFCWATFCFNDFGQSIWHRIDQLSQFRNIQWASSFDQSGFQLTFCFESTISKRLIELISQMFSRIEIWTLCWPFKQMHAVFFHPALSRFSCMLRIVVLLKNEIGWQVQLISRLEQMLVQNATVVLGVHSRINKF